jgi:hypothetical protein
LCFEDQFFNSRDKKVSKTKLGSFKSGTLLQNSSIQLQAFDEISSKP